MTFKLPEHFSVLSAQHDKMHNEDAHKRLKKALERYGFEFMEVLRHYGYPEQSFLVEHSGSLYDTKILETLAFKNNDQESILHVDNETSELRFRDKRPSSIGIGYDTGDSLDDFYTLLPSGVKFRMRLN
jgi:hypothetical protein